MMLGQFSLLSSQYSSSFQDHVSVVGLRSAEPEMSVPLILDTVYDVHALIVVSHASPIIACVADVFALDGPVSGRQPPCNVMSLEASVCAERAGPSPTGPISAPAVGCEPNPATAGFYSYRSTTPPFASYRRDAAQYPNYTAYQIGRT